MTPGILYVGTHARAHRADPVDAAFGIYAFGSRAGDTEPVHLGLTQTRQSGWIAIHPGGRYLYAVNEVADFDGAEGGGVTAFEIDAATGTLRELNRRRTSALPCHCEVDATGRYLLVATFGGGAIHLFPLARDGSIEPQSDMHRHAGSSAHPRRQSQPHAHGVTLDAANRFVLVPDLGIDQILVYELDRAAGRLLPRPRNTVRVAPGSGPRHIVFDARARFAYLMNEMTATIAAFAWDAESGTLREIQSVDLLPEGFNGLRSGAELCIERSGRFLYATTRSHGSSGEPPVRGLDNLVWYAIDDSSGLLTLCGRVPSGGEIPRSFTQDGGDELLVGHQCSGTIIAFRIDARTGKPSATGRSIATPVPVCLRFVSSAAASE